MIPVEASGIARSNLWQDRKKTNSFWCMIVLQGLKASPLMQICHILRLNVRAFEDPQRHAVQCRVRVTRQTAFCLFRRFHLLQLLPRIAVSLQFCARCLSCAYFSCLLKSSFSSSSSQLSSHRCVVPPGTSVSS